MSNKMKKYSTVVKLILKGYTTEQIAKETGYSTGTIRNIYTELREECEVSSKTEIALAFVGDRLSDILKEMNELASLLPRYQMIPPPKDNQLDRLRQKKRKK